MTLPPGLRIVRRTLAFTLVDMLIVIATLALITVVLLPHIARPQRHSCRINCVNNLKQVGLAFRTWALDNQDNYPMAVPVSTNGTMEYTSDGLRTYMHFLVMSNELSTPKILICPTENDPARRSATTFSVGEPQTSGSSTSTVPFNSNSNLSYFVAVSAREQDPQLFLSGDRNLTNGLPLRNGVMDIPVAEPLGWTETHHKLQGNVALADGSVQQFSSSRLRAAAALNGGTNHLSMPILGSKP